MGPGVYRVEGLPACVDDEIGGGSSQSGFEIGETSVLADDTIDAKRHSA